jgi:2-polyprenyl-6-methoxyphenol hydroxylase-like FAD-dependent oxidoreductase
MNVTVVHEPDVSVLIVGTGSTGLTVACEMARRGVDFGIVEKATDYAAGSCGRAVQPRSLESLDDLGGINRILVHGLFHPPVRSDDGATVLGDHDMHEGRNPAPQWGIGETLRLRLAECGAGDSRRSITSLRRSKKLIRRNGFAENT